MQANKFGRLKQKWKKIIIKEKERKKKVGNWSQINVTEL